MAGNVLTGSGEKKFLCSNVFFSIKQQVKIIFGNFFFGSGSINTFAAKLFSENHRFSPKIFKTLKCSHSLNFDRTGKLQTFLKPSDSDLSKTVVF